MNILLDTHVLIWALDSPERIHAEAQATLENGDNTVFFSAASIWEISIKISLDRADFSFSPELVQQKAIETGFIELPVQSTHTLGVSRMPWHHRDPFDRLLIAQALSIPAWLYTADDTLLAYSELVRKVA